MPNTLMLLNIIYTSNKYHWFIKSLLMNNATDVLIPYVYANSIEDFYNF